MPSSWWCFLGAFVDCLDVGLQGGLPVDVGSPSLLFFGPSGAFQHHRNHYCRRTPSDVNVCRNLLDPSPFGRHQILVVLGKESESPLERRLNFASERVTPERLTTVLVSGGVESGVGPARGCRTHGFRFLRFA